MKTDRNNERAHTRKNRCKQVGLIFFAVEILLVAFQTAGNRGNVDNCRFACVVCGNCEFESEERSVGSLIYASHPLIMH